MKLKDVICVFAIALIPMLSFVSCDKEAPDSLWNFKISGQWKCAYGFDDMGIVTFYDDGTGVCATSYDNESAGAPFSYTYTKDKKEPNGKLVITSTAKASDYPDLDPGCIAFHPGEYILSPHSTSLAYILIGNNTIKWRIFRNTTSAEDEK